jgi:iron complex outermembrane recepter protein
VFTANNILNLKYETNGYSFSYYEGQDLKTFNYLAPAALRNYFVGVSFGF